MAREIMRQKASDNKYLHKDFPSILSGGIEYLDHHYGEEAVRQYLRQFTSSFYAPRNMFYAYPEVLAHRRTDEGTIGGWTAW